MRWCVIGAMGCLAACTARTFLFFPDSPGGDCPDGAGTVCATGLEGFGADTAGGEGGIEVHVTTLADSGPGSLREALAGSGRTVRFDVAGTIALDSTVVISGADITVDGFSAPLPGITLTGASLAIVGNSASADTPASNIIIRGLRFRSVPDDALRVTINAHDVVIDHNSFYDSQDGEVDVTEGAYNVTISYNIFANNTAAGTSLLAFDAGHVTYHHNIFFENPQSNPSIVGTTSRFYSSGAAHEDPVADVRYNILWEYGMGIYVSSEGGVIGTANVVSNLLFTAGGNPANGVVRDTLDGTPRGDAYVAGNAAIHDVNGCAFSVYGTPPCYSVATANAMNSHVPFPASTISGPAPDDDQGRLDVWQAVLDHAGVIDGFADDAIDSNVRAGVILPTLAIFNEPWND